MPAGRSEAQRALATILGEAAAGRFPPSDGTVTVLAQPSDRDAGVISFTGCAVVFADIDPSWVTAQLPRSDLSAPLSSSFLAALGERLGRRSHSVDMLTCAPAATGPPPDLELTELGISTATGHARVTRALRYRDQVRVWQTVGGVLVIGRGVAGRWETAIEVDADQRGRGLGRRLATAARHLVPAGATLW
ncbi:MAG: GNAT family N-acetyltransferase, partial [Actinobacteria bacterium]|nr:GNAT family N-acetyltransferase [Actinomycetota bacterium]